MADDLMRTYSYTAVTANGDRKKGKMDADSPTVVIQSLQGEGLIPINVVEASSSILQLNITRPKTERDYKMKSEPLLIFTRQLYLLLRAGLSVHRSMTVIGADNDDALYTRMCNDISERVLAGTALSKAMALYPRSFNEVYCAYIAAGEQTGDMERSVERLAKVLEQAHSLRLKVKAVTAYPKLVSIAVMGLVYGILTFLVPMYAKIYAGFGQNLPGPTQFLVDLSHIIAPFHVNIGILPPHIGLQKGRSLLTSPINFQSPIFWILAAVIGWMYFRRRTKDDLVLGTRIERVKFSLPMLGKMWKYSVLYRWSSTMAGSLDAGLQTFASLEIAGNTAGSAWVSNVSKDLMEAVRAGRPLSQELGKHPDLFNAQLRAMASTGEEAGEAAEMFANVAAALEDELDAMVATLGARLEVALLMVMGAVVGSLLVVLYLPILNLTKVAGNGYGANV
jgi:type IV pilus assembly protein PilC